MRRRGRTAMACEGKVVQPSQQRPWESRGICRHGEGSVGVGVLSGARGGDGGGECAQRRARGGDEEGGDYSGEAMAGAAGGGPAIWTLDISHDDCPLRLTSSAISSATPGPRPHWPPHTPDQFASAPDIQASASETFTTCPPAVSTVDDSPDHEHVPFDNHSSPAPAPNHSPPTSRTTSTLPAERRLISTPLCSRWTPGPH